MIDGTLAIATNTPLTSPRPAPIATATADGRDRRKSAVVGQQLGGEVGRHADRGAHRQIDVAGDDHERLARREQRGDGDRDEEAAHESGAQVVVDDDVEQQDRGHQHGDERESLHPLGPQPAPRRTAAACGGSDHGAPAETLLTRHPPRPRHDPFLFEVGSLEDPHLAALAHDEHAVAHGEDLREVGRDQDHRDARRRQLADELVDVRLGADVDAAGRLVEHEHGRLDVEPLGEHHLLLVAAREVADGGGQRCRADAEALAVAVGGAPFRVAVDQSPARHEPSQARRG